MIKRVQPILKMLDGERDSFLARDLKCVSSATCSLSRESNEGSRMRKIKPLSPSKSLRSAIKKLNQPVLPYN